MPLMGTTTCPGNLGSPDACAAKVPWETVTLLPIFSSDGWQGIETFLAEAALRFAVAAWHKMLNDRARIGSRAGLSSLL